MDLPELARLLQLVWILRAKGSIIPNRAIESVAEFTKRPLLAITAADLGHDPTILEKNLLTFFRDANDWEAIVLLDEADA